MSVFCACAEAGGYIRLDYKFYSLRRLPRTQVSRKALALSRPCASSTTDDTRVTGDQSFKPFNARRFVSAKLSPQRHGPLGIQQPHAGKQPCLFPRHSIENHHRINGQIEQGKQEKSKPQEISTEATTEKPIATEGGKIDKEQISSASICRLGC